MVVDRSKLKKALIKRKSNIADSRKNSKKGMAQLKIEENFPKLEEFFLEKDRDMSNMLKKSLVGFFGSSELVYLFELFQEIDLKSYWSFADLGSGDGRIVFLASLFTSSVGVEKDKELYRLSLKRKEELGDLILSPTEFRNNDFYKESLDGFGLVFINPAIPFYQDGFEEFLFRNKADYLIDITLFQPRFLVKKKEFKAGLRRYALYSTK